MDRYSDTAIEIINDIHTEQLDYETEYLPLINAAIRLSDYEDSGAKPDRVAEVMDIVKDIPVDHLRELIQTDRALARKEDFNE